MNAPLRDVAFAFLGWIWECSWQASLLVLAVLLAQAVFGRRLAPGWRYGLWILVAIRLLLPALPESRASIYGVVSPAGEFAQSRIREALGFQGDTGVSSMVQVAPIEAPSKAASLRAATLPWQGGLALVWLAGAVWLLVRMAIATARFRAAVRRSRQVPSAEVREILNEAAWAFRMRAPEAIETTAISSPAVTGLLRPLIVLPVGLEKRFSREEIRFLLLHELAHIRRGDLLAHFVAGILHALHWFNPILWIAMHRVRHDREAACDARVLGMQHPESRGAYGQTLIKVLEGLQPPRHSVGVVGILESRRQLRQRLLRIASYARPTKIAIVGGALVLLVLAATMLTRAATKPEKSPSAPPAIAEAKGEPSETFSVHLLTAARAGDGAQIQKIVEKSYKGPEIGEDGATQLLDSLVVTRELNPFTVLLKELRQTNLGKSWQPNDALLAGIVKDGRKDFLDVFLAERLDLKRLQALQKNADPGMAAWLARRLAETERARADGFQLVDACGKGDVARARKLLGAGVDVNGRTADGNSWTPLTRAASANRAEVVKLLLERGAQVDLPKHPGWDYTPLCLTSSVEVANLLKAAGANVHATLFHRDTSILTYVAEFNGAPMVRWFLDQGLDPKMIGDNDETLLFGVKDAATAEILLKAGVDPNRPDEFGKVALQNARNAGVVKALIKGGARLSGFKNPLIPGMIQMSSGDAVAAVLDVIPKLDPAALQAALISAAHGDRDKTAEALIKHGAKANEPGEWSGPDHMMLPLEVCCIFGSPKTARVLLAHGADPNGGKTPGQLLQIAIHNQEKEMVEILKAAGAKGASNLSIALATGDRKRVAELLQRAPLYSKDPQFWDGALSSAAERGDLETVKAAIKSGVPVLVKNSQSSEDAYSSAAFEGQYEVLDFLLRQRGPESDPKELPQALWSAVWNCHPYPNQRPTADFERCVRLLLDAGAPVRDNKEAKYGLVTTAVFSRYPGGNPRVVEMLIAAGADPNPEVNKGKRLTDALAESFQEKNCSTPDEQVVAAVERGAGVTIRRGK